MSKKYFGTDGIRGRVGEVPITPELVLRLGYAAGRVLSAESAGRRGETPAVAEFIALAEAAAQASAPP